MVAVKTPLSLARVCLLTRRAEVNRCSGEGAELFARARTTSKPSGVLHSTQLEHFLLCFSPLDHRPWPQPTEKHFVALQYNAAAPDSPTHLVHCLSLHPTQR